MSEAPFDRLAAEYDRCAALTAVGRLQRAQVHRRIAPLFAPGSRVLELGCGTGLDALYLAQLGLSVLASDPAAAMLAVAQARCQDNPRISLRQLAAEQVSLLEETFDGAFSNFAALNCVLDLSGFAAALAGRLRPGAPAALVLFGRLCLWEMLGYLAQGRLRQAGRRLHSGLVEAGIGEGLAIPIRYYSSDDVRRAFAPHFQIESSAAIGVAVPPTYLARLIGNRPALLAALDRFDTAFGALWPWRALGDHVLYVLRRR